MKPAISTASQALPAGSPSFAPPTVRSNAPDIISAIRTEAAIVPMVIRRMASMMLPTRCRSGSTVRLRMASAIEKKAPTAPAAAARQRSRASFAGLVTAVVDRMAVMTARPIAKAEIRYSKRAHATRSFRMSCLIIPRMTLAPGTSPSSAAMRASPTRRS